MKKFWQTTNLFVQPIETCQNIKKYHKITNLQIVLSNQNYCRPKPLDDRY